MNVLEKILQEIEERIKKLKEADNICRVNAERNRNFESVKYFQSLMFATERAKSIIGDIIRSRMSDNDELIDRKALKEEIESLRMTITGMRSGKTITIQALEEYKKSILRIIDEQPTVHANDGWIPVEERLPEDDRYILLSFENFSLPLVGRYEENEKGGAFYLGDCNEEDTCISNDLYVNAWTYLPERYKGGDDRA